MPVDPRLVPEIDIQIDALANKTEAESDPELTAARDGATPRDQIEPITAGSAQPHSSDGTSLRASRRKRAALAATKSKKQGGAIMNDTGTKPLVEHDDTSLVALPITAAPALAAAHPPYYSEIKLELDANPPRLEFVRAPTSPPPPADVRALRRQIEDVGRLVRILFADDRRRLEEFFKQLQLTADSGLRGTNSSVEAGLDNLQDVKNSIADAFPAVRGKIWWWNCGLLVAIVAICAAASVALYYTKGIWFPDLDESESMWPALQLAPFLIPLGVMIGLFTEFLFRVNDDIPYEQLRAINPGRWKPIQRLFNTIIVACIFAGVLGIGAVQVGIANVLLNDFIDKKPFLSLVIGFVTGFSFPYVRDLLQQFRPVRRDAAA
jgi:hypothetical protein